MRIKTVLVNDQIAALGIDTHKPVFHIIWEDDRQLENGDAFRIYVADENENMMWDFGKCLQKESYIYYGGLPLKAKTSYRVYASIYAGQEVVQCFETCFETGFMGEPWMAQWVEPAQEDAVEEKTLDFFEMVTYVDDGQSATRLRPCQDVKKDFTCRGGIKRARVYATAHGVYQLYLNGQAVSERRLAPETSCYEENLYYQTYDITKLLNEGANTISATLADGWWIGRLAMAGDSCNYGKRLAFLMQLEIEYEDGRRDMIISDENMLGRESYISYADLFIGEKWDLTKTPGTWQPCSVVDFSLDNLNGQPIAPVCVTQVLENPQVLETPAGELVLDFGQVMAGVVHIEVQAKYGDVLVLEHGEVLDENGNFMCNILGRNKDQKDVCVCREGEQVFEPLFTYHGLRYVRVSGIDRAQILNASALVIGTPLRKIGEFHCSDERLNQLQHNIEWSARSNMCSVPTDCPQREKLGWTGDIQVFAKTGCFNYDLKNFLEGWLANVRIDQTENGEIPVVVPNFKHQDRTQRMMSGDNSSAVWGDACVLVPYALYQAYGDVQVLKSNFAMMCGWMDFIASVCARVPEGYEDMSTEQKEREKYLWTKCYHFGDWLIPSLRERPDGVPLGTKVTAPVVGSAFYALVTKYFIEICDILGETKLADEARARLPKIKDAVARTFVAEDGTVNGSDLQGLYVMILACEIVDGELRQKVLEHLVRLIKDNDYCLDTGFSSVSYLLDVLYDNGYPDVAYRVLFNTKAPSWLYMVEKGATSIWENWKAIREDGTPTASSYNHYAFGCVGEWIYRHIGGIKCLAPGYKKVLFDPDFACGLSQAQCSVLSPYGKISCEWQLKAGKYHVRVHVPEGCSAWISHNGGQTELRQHGDMEFVF